MSAAPKTAIRVERYRDERREGIRTGVVSKSGVVRYEVSRRPALGRFDVRLHRIREIEIVIRARHGSIVPDPAGTDDAETVLSYAEAVALARSRQGLAAWGARWMPWADPARLHSIELSARGSERMQDADACALLLGVTLAERDRLGLTTIGASDVSAEARRALRRQLKRARDRKAAAARRSKQGSIPRGEYLAKSLSARRPWADEGISRSAWERQRRKSGNAASASPANIYISVGDGLAASGAGAGENAGAGAANGEAAFSKRKKEVPASNTTPPSPPSGSAPAPADLTDDLFGKLVCDAQASPEFVQSLQRPGETFEQRVRSWQARSAFLIYERHFASTRDSRGRYWADLPEEERRRLTDLATETALRHFRALGWFEAADA